VYRAGVAIVPAALLLLTGCGEVREDEAKAQSGRSEQAAPVAVETAVAKTGSLETTIEYTGTTAPIREVSLRAQTEGRLLDLVVDVGDRVNRNAVLGQVDNQLLVAQVNQQRAELAALESEVAQSEAEVSDAKAQVEQARVALQQAQSDANRQQLLVKEGAITAQAAEQSITQVRTAEQTLRSAQEQVRTRQQAVVAAERRVKAQEATLAEVQAREAYSSLTSPISGAVLQRVAQPGDLLQPGNEVLRLGDFSAVKVVVQVSERELGDLRVGQSAQVRLDAFSNQTLQGRVARISPAADPTARLIPVEITIPNPEGRIGSGLLARVQFQSVQGNQVIVPETALSVGGDAVNPQNANGANPANSTNSSANQALNNQASDNTEPTTAQLFVVMGAGEQAKVTVRSVQLGAKQNGQVEIRSGLKPGDTFVIRSSKPLKTGQPVRLSILSETSS
jgi:multidrug efflux pump subunit AcrA (membrane-fusion protein)